MRFSAQSWLVAAPGGIHPPTNVEHDLRGVLTDVCGQGAVVCEPAAARARWPPWWSWDLLLTSHAWERMADRGISETDLRSMLESATEYQRDVVIGRWRIEVEHEGWLWHVIVEPDYARELLVLITVYRVEE